MKKHVGLALAIASTALVAQPTAAEAAVTKNCTVITHRAIYKHTEEQPIGVKAAKRWGWAEVDARMTKDGRVVAMHDARMTRVSGGASRQFVHDLTLKEIRALPYEYGSRVQTVGRLIRQASRNRSRIMVQIQGYKLTKDKWDNGGLASLWKSAQRHRRPRLVYFGGPGGGKAMRAAHPKASSFVKYKKSSTGIPKHVRENGVDIASLPRSRFDKGLVRRLRRAGALVASDQLGSRRGVRKANRAGIRIIQTNKARTVATRWCLPRR